VNTAVIIGGGEFPKKAYPRELIRQADVIVCCDGNALKAFLRNREKIFNDSEREPDAVVGDMDSMPKRLAKQYSHLLAKVDEQDDNDQTKAFRYVLEHYPEVDTIHFIAATGKREDHTVGNLGLLMEYARSEAGTVGERSRTIDMVSDYSTAFAITESCELVLGKGRRISIFSPDNSLTIKSDGLEWPTDKVVFDNWWKATLNRTNKDVLTLELSHKSLVLVVVD
jgi:thiamine pyrophosphokinase